MKKHLQKPEITNFAAIWQKDILILDGLEKGQLIQLKNQIGIKKSMLIGPVFGCLSSILFLRLETLQLMLLKLFEQINFLSNCSKRL